jgi:hypothetical protein
MIVWNCDIRFCTTPESCVLDCIWDAMRQLLLLTVLRTRDHTVVLSMQCTFIAGDIMCLHTHMCLCVCV